MRKGFTLVEISIVLVIIGLLIGGILVAQSMISTARLQAFLRQVGQYDAAVENFVTKFGQLPGDNNLMGGVRGNNDSQLSANNYFMTEMGKFWSDLSSSGLAKTGGGSYVDDSSGFNSGLDVGSYVPKAAFGSEAYFIAFGADIPGINFYYVGGYLKDGGGYGILPQPAYRPAEVLSVDNKIDDGVPVSGNVKATDESSILLMQPNAGGIVSGTDCVNGSAYVISSSDLTCMIRIRIGTISGSLR